MRQRTELRQQHKQEFNARFSTAIQILQMPAVELAAQIQDALDSNPLLEQYETYESEPFDSTDAVPDTPLSTISDTSTRLEYAVDAQQTETVRDHLLRELWSAGMSGSDRIIAQVIIESINDRGYLTESTDEIHQLLAPRLDIRIEAIERVVTMVQQFGPPGIGARNLVECLHLQLDDSIANRATVNHARQILQEHLELLTENNFVQLCARLNADEAAVDAAVSLIRTLNPSPGHQFGRAAQTIMPDLIVRKVDGRWQVRLNPEALPNLRISNDYRMMINRIDSGKGQEFLKKNLSSASAFLDHVKRRHATVLRVARQILSHQREFLDAGEACMRPLKMSDVAEALNLHESTVSRACSQKYIMTPRGTYELKHFFSVRIPNRIGEDESAEAIKHKIVQLVEHEDLAAPLSDQQITDQLQRSGTEISRRTVAKYRGELRIPARSRRATIFINQLKTEVV